MEKEYTSCLVFLDIETIAGTDSFDFKFEKQKPTMSDVPKNGTLKDPTKIIEWEQNKLKSLQEDWVKEKQKAYAEQEQEWRGQALKSYLGRVLCVSYAINDGEIKTIDFCNGEKEMLQEFYNDIRLYKVVKFIGTNIEEFDLLFLLHRALHFKLYDLANLLRNDRGWSKDRNYDIMHLSAGALSWKYRISLNNLCNLLGVKTSKDGIDGSKVMDFYLKGDIAKIRHYCQDDVRATRECFYILK
jgi:predicted PolB exonuclease-like 3'-5' exonuclease